MTNDKSTTSGGTLSSLSQKSASCHKSIRNLRACFPTYTNTCLSLTAGLKTTQVKPQKHLNNRTHILTFEYLDIYFFHGHLSLTFSSCNQSTCPSLLLLIFDSGVSTQLFRLSGFFPIFYRRVCHNHFTNI